MTGDGAGFTVVVDARSLLSSGIGRYLREVLAGVLRDPRVTHATLLGHAGELREFVRARGVERRVRVVPFEFGFYSAGAQAAWLALRARGELRADVAFFPHYDVPVTHGGIPSVVMVHDLSHFRLGWLFPWWKRAAARVVLARAVGGASRVLVPSRATARDLVQDYPRTAARVQVIPQGVDVPPPPQPGSPEAAQARAMRPYLLCVGNRKPHKNLGAAVEVLARVRRTHPGVRLVLAGGHFAEGDEVAERSAALGVADAVTDLGRVSDAQLRALYAEAVCLLFPSLYEGFGLPVLEAMAAGVPVVASDRAAIPEVVGDAGFVAAPDDAAAMAAAVERLLDDPDLRAERVRRGLERARGFTWAETAARTADALAAVAAGRRR